ncbi:MAG: trigger factor [Planctomycetota bacterium]
MELNVDKTATAVAKISFSVPASELNAELERGLKSVSRNVKMKGFRPGKVPKKVLEKAYGGNLRQEVIGHFIQRAYSQAVKEHELKPLAHPRLSEDALKTAEDGSISAEFEVPLRPSFDLPTYTGLTIASELEPVMDQQVDAALDEFRESQSTPEAAGDAGLDEKGFLLGDVEFLHEGERVFHRERMRLSVLSVPPGVDAEAFKAALLGTQNGAVHEFPMTLPNYLDNEAQRGQPGTCRVSVLETFNLTPPTDEHLCGLLEVEDMPALRDKVREKLGEAAAAREDQRIESALLDQVLGATHLELPEPIIEQQTLARLGQFDQSLAEQQLTEEDRAAQVEAQRPTAREEAIKGLKALLVVESLGEKEGLLVTNEELTAELHRIAARNQAKVEEVHKFYSEEGRGQQLAIELLERKVRKFLREKADIQAPA